jgi:hypothetical protein
MTFAGHVTCGAVTSATVTVKLHIAVRPPESVAVHVTVVVPTAKLVPGIGEHVTVAEQLSVAVGTV